MKYLANENIPKTSANILKESGWDIEHIGETNMGITDEEVMEIAIAENRIIITFDSDYGELVYKYGYKPPGIIYLRIQKFTPEYPANLLLKLITEENLEIDGLFTVIDENQIRQRKLK